MNNQEKKKVLILLSTYNGEKYLREQLDSIVRQKDVEVSVLVRDDGSKDGTLKTLEEYKQKYPSMFILEEGKNVGCRMSFFWLIKKAADDYPDFDYYAFADQDDVWLEDKLISGVRALDDIDNPYKVYYCSYQMVDENLNEIPTPQNKNLGTLEEAFVFQPCLGCTMIFSPMITQKASLGTPEKCNIHDVWTYRLNLALGGEIIQDESVYILYRQHSSNVVGSNQSFKSRWKRRFKSFKTRKHIISELAGEIIKVNLNELPINSLKTLQLINKYHQNFSYKLLLLFSNKFKTRKRLHNIMFKLAVLTNRI